MYIYIKILVFISWNSVVSGRQAIIVVNFVRLANIKLQL